MRKKKKEKKEKVSLGSWEVLAELAVICASSRCAMNLVLKNLFVIIFIIFPIFTVS